MGIKSKIVAALVFQFAGAVAAQTPLSAIDWLDNAASLPNVRSLPDGILTEPPVTETAIIPDVQVAPLDQAAPDAVGLLPSSVTGLPASIWEHSNGADLAALLARIDVSGSPAMQSLLYTLVLAEADQPKDDQPGTFLGARVDALMDLGALEPAEALLLRSGADTLPLFRRWFDTSLLLGTEDGPCDRLASHPHLAPDYAARVYCTARNGDWSAALLTLESAQSLKLVSPLEDELLIQFLEPELIDESHPMPPPPAISPLVFRLYEAIGSSLGTSTLPRAYAMADLRNLSGWKAELEAAERLARVGALSENRLMAIYTARLPAASGGVWDRVEAIQRFDTALQSGDPGAVSAALPRAWSAMRKMHLEVPFARFFGAKLRRLPLSGSAKATAFRIALLTPDYEAAARSHTAANDEEAFLIGVALGEAANARPFDSTSRAIASGFGAARPTPHIVALLDQGKLGEAVLQAVLLHTGAVEGDIADMARSLAAFRTVGLEDTVRRAALQLLLLNRGG